MDMKKILFPLLALALIAFLVWWLIQAANTPSLVYEKVTLPEDNEILNTTQWDYLDTVVNVGMQGLGVHGVPIAIQPMSDRVSNGFEESEGLELEAYIAEWQDGYTLCVNGDLGHDHAIDVISHELIHLSQYVNKELVLKSGTAVSWMGEDYDLSLIPYNDRPWEHDAFANQHALAGTIRARILK